MQDVLPCLQRPLVVNDDGILSPTNITPSSSMIHGSSSSDPAGQAGGIGNNLSSEHPAQFTVNNATSKTIASLLTCAPPDRGEYPAYLIDISENRKV